MKVLAIIGWVVAVPFLALMWWGGAFTKHEDQIARNEEARFHSKARAACITMTRRLMNDPRSAEWVDDHIWPVSVLDETIYQVRMTYRAKNAMGGTVTENALCRVRRDGDQAFAIRLE